MIVIVGDGSLRQARRHIRDGCVKWKHYLNDVSNIADQSETVRGRIKQVEMRFSTVADQSPYSLAD